MAAIHTIQMLGLIGAASYLAARAARASRHAAWHRYALLAQPRSALPAMPRGFRVEELGPVALDGQMVDADAETRSRRFSEGLTCLGAVDVGERLTGVIWLREHHHDEDEVAVRFLVPPSCCWDTGLWIAPEFRLGRTFAALWAGVGTWMDQRGLSHSLSRVSDYNLAALNAHRRMGAQILAHHSFVRFGSWQWSVATQPRLMRIDDGQGATLDLAPLWNQAKVSAS